MVWSDEFDGTSLDTTKWHVYDGTGVQGITAHAANVSVANSMLRLRLVDNSSGAAINSWGTQYGFGPSFSSPPNGHGLQVGECVEFRVSIPTLASGVVPNWPAVWTSGHTIQDNDDGGEIDLAEGLSGGLAINYHNTGHDINGPRPPGDWSGFHTFTAVRGSANYYVYWDGKLMWTTPNFDLPIVPQGILATNGFNTQFGGPLSVPADMLIDYVRVWKPATTVMPAGVPASQVGKLLLDANGANMLAWQHSTSGNQGQNVPGSYSIDASGNLVLSLPTGNSNEFAQVEGPAFGPEGIYESRIYLPDDGNGLIADWPAWWLYGGNQADELDIIEGLGGKSAVHLWWKGGNVGGGWMTTDKSQAGTPICKPGWNVGTAVITATNVQVYLNGVLFSTFGNNPLATPMRVIHDLTGARAGQPPKPATYRVEYTRVWALA